MNIKKYERRKRREEIRKAEKEYSKEEKPKKRERYGTMSPGRRFVNKNAGFITVGIVLLIIFIAWVWHDSTLEEFEKFTCSQIEQFKGLEGLTDDQMVKWNKVVAECQGEFTPP